MEKSSPFSEHASSPSSQHATSPFFTTCNRICGNLRRQKKWSHSMYMCLRQCLCKIIENFLVYFLISPTGNICMHFEGFRKTAERDKDAFSCMLD